jgi:hypothetical protein
VLSLANGVDVLFLGGFEGSAIYAVVGEQYGTIYGGRYQRDGEGNIVIDDDPNSDTYGYPLVDAQIGVIGDVNPDWIAGLTTTLSWKGLSIYGLLDVRQGGQIWNGTYGAITYFGRAEETDKRGTTTTFEGVKGHVDETGAVITEGPNDIVAELNQGYYQSVGSSFVGPAEANVEDGSYIKLKELSLTYSLNPKWLEKTPIAGFDISVVGRNLWLSTDYKGVDPETSLTGANNSQGMDYFNMPGTRSFGLNLRLTL